MKKIMYLALVAAVFGPVCDNAGAAISVQSLTEEEKNALWERIASLPEDMNDMVTRVDQGLSSEELKKIRDFINTPMQAVPEPQQEQDTSGDKDLARAQQEEEDAAVVAEQALVEPSRDRSARIMPEYVRFVQTEATPRNAVCPTLHSYSGGFVTIACMVCDVKADHSVMDFQRRISAQLSPLGDLPNVVCALTVQPNMAVRDEGGKVMPMLFRPQWGFNRGVGSDFDEGLGGVPKHREMQCPSVLRL